MLDNLQGKGNVRNVKSNEHLFLYELFNVFQRSSAYDFLPQFHIEAMATKKFTENVAANYNID